MPLQVPDLERDLERVSDDKNAFLILTFFSSNFRLFHVRSCNNRFNIFKNAFYVFVLFWNDGTVLDRSICSCEITIVPQE